MTNSILEDLESLSTVHHIKSRLYYNEGEHDACLKSIREASITNPRHENKHSKHITFAHNTIYTAGDLLDMERYGLLPIRTMFSKSVNKPNKTNKQKPIDDNIFNDLMNNKLPSIYKSIDLESTHQTMLYMFNKLQKGILVAIEDNKLKVFLPFYNKKWENDYIDKLYFNEQDKKNLEKLKKLLSKSTKTATESNEIRELMRLSKDEVSKFYKSRGNSSPYLLDRTKWLANDCMAVNHYPIKSKMTHGGGEYFYLLSEVLKHRQVNDVVFFISYRDIPVLKNDRTEPFELLYNNYGLIGGSSKSTASSKSTTSSKSTASSKSNNKSNNKSKSVGIKLGVEYSKTQFIPICTPTTASGYANLPIIDSETIQIISNKLFPKKCDNSYTKEKLKDIIRDWSKKKNVAVFRGGATGCGITVDTNKRLKVADLSVDNSDILDGGITDWNARTKKTSSGVLGVIDQKAFRFGIADKKSRKEMSEFKYVVHIEGHSAAFRLGYELSLNSVMLFVKGKYEVWCNQFLTPGIHYIEIKEDLSDLVDKIKWCKKHDAECKKIAGNAMKFYETYLTKDGCFDYMQSVLHQMSGIMSPKFITNTKSKKKVAVITIYRDTANKSRSKQRKLFIELMNALLEPLGGFHIYIITQSDDGEKFNIGKLKNIGFEIASKGGYDNYIFSDIDAIPDTQLIKYFYKTMKGVYSLARWGTRYKSNNNNMKGGYNAVGGYNANNKNKMFMGTLIGCNKDSFIKINGYPNNLWGWGGEDDILRDRIIRCDVDLQQNEDGQIIDMEMKDNKTIEMRNKLNQLKNKNLKEPAKREKRELDEKHWETNGLNSLIYKVLKTTKVNKTTTEYEVDLKKKEDVKKRGAIPM